MTDPVIIARVAVLATHAAAAVVALVAAVLALHTGRGLATHRVAVVIMAGCLVPSIALGWAGFSGTEKVIFVGLLGLAIVMVGQAFRAGRVRSAEIASGRVVVLGRRPGALPVGPAFVATLGFNAIALTVAGSIVPVLRVGGGTVGVIIAVAVTVGIGHLLVARRGRAVTEALATTGVRPVPAPA